jgi:hypothetical protein
LLSGNLEDHSTISDWLKALHRNDTRSDETGLVPTPITRILIILTLIIRISRILKTATLSGGLRSIRSHRERLPRRAGLGLGAHSPHQTCSSDCRKSFVGFTGFPERQQQNSELSDNSPLLGLSGAVLGQL